MSLGARRLHSVKRQARLKISINTALQRGERCLLDRKPFKRLL